MSSLIELVVEEAKLRGFRVERITASSRKDVLDKRLLLIDFMRCQVIPSKLGHPSEAYPRAEYLPMYLPRTSWADFLIYVSLANSGPVFHIVPRFEMSKDTGRSPDSLEPYRDAWELLQRVLAEAKTKKFETLSWQLQAIKQSAQGSGIEVEFINTKKNRVGRRWPPIIKRRVLVAGKKCAVFTATRINTDPNTRENSYAVFKASKEKWPEFQLYVVRGKEKNCDIFVVPRNHLTESTTASIDHPELARYKNAWDLLKKTTDDLDRIPPIMWKEPTITPGPTKHHLILQDTLRKVESEGLTAKAADDVVSHKGVQSFLYASGKRCQVMQSNVITGTNGFQYIPLTPSTSAWPDFLIFRVARPGDANEAAFYIIPKSKLPRHTSRSIASEWLREFHEAWHLLR